MTIDDLEAELRKANVNPEAYSLAGGTHWYDRYCVEAVHGGRWRVYFVERGEREDVHEFDTESEACDYFLAWITKDQTVFLQS